MTGNPNNLIEQADYVQTTDWDYLIVLDDFRFDIFEELYDDYLPVDGEIWPVWSAGSHTIHWLSELWPDEYPEITYVSGHALINSAGIPGFRPVRLEATEAGVDGDYIPAEHFPNIIDVWDWGYMEQIETVPPWTMNEVLRGNGPVEKPEPPVIAHYVQPHFPWVRGHIYAEKHDLPTDDGYRREWRPGPTTSHGPQFRRAWVRKHLGMEGVRMAYRDNAVVALDGLSEVVGDLDGTVVVTSDHGEKFEKGVTHPPGSDDIELRTVPWVEL